MPPNVRPEAIPTRCTTYPLTKDREATRATNGRDLHSNRVTHASRMVSLQSPCTCAEANALMKQRAVDTHHTLTTSVS